MISALRRARRVLLGHISLLSANVPYSNLTFLSLTLARSECLRCALNSCELRYRSYCDCIIYFDLSRSVRVSNQVYSPSR